MEEENQKTEEEKTEVKVLDRAEEAAERLEEANKRYEELIRKEEELKAERLLSGKSEAGKPPVEPKEETPQEYAQRILKNEI